MVPYILSLLLSIPGLIMSIALTLAEFDPDSTLYKYFGIKETVIVLAVSFIFLVIGWKADSRFEELRAD